MVLHPTRLPAAFSVLVLGTKQERAIRGAASTAVEMMAQELRPEGGEQAEQLAMVVDQVFSDPMPDASFGEHATMLELLQAGVARQLAVLDDAGVQRDRDDGCSPGRVRVFNGVPRRS